MANEASDNINFIVSNFEQRIRKETSEIQRMYLNSMEKITNCMDRLVLLVHKNSAAMKELAEGSKVRFAMFDMKRRNLGGGNPALRPVMDTIWNAAMQLDPDVGRREQNMNERLGRKVEVLNGEPVYEEIYRKRNARKIQPKIGFTLKEEIASAQAEYLRNHGVVAEEGEGPKGNQTMEEFRRPR